MSLKFNFLEIKSPARICVFAHAGLHA